MTEPALRRRPVDSVQHHVVVPYAMTNSTVRARATQWIDRLVRRGVITSEHVAVHGPGQPRRSVPSDSDVLLLRNARRLTRGRSEQALLRRARLGVYDLDDGLPWDDGTLPLLGRWWKRPWPRSLVARRAASASDRVIVGNEILAAWASELCNDVRVIPTCVEPADIRRRTWWEVARPSPIIGWIGSPATEPYLWDLAPALRAVHRRTGARLHVVSGPGGLPAAVAEFTQRSTWSLDLSHEVIATWDVGIMPLRDGAYERAKCGYKLLQYAAAGVPAVGSPVGVNAPLLSAMDGLAPANVDEWVDALVRVIEEPADRRARRAAAGASVAAAYSYDEWEDAWVRAVGWVAS